ncbi:putative U3 small nucleolar RNA-associated protein 13 [Heracleum sosnowskyi]|uniref:U3 small nucleolar RNA-associated protein 13 n=1 Tax=Heracleum sosnowskyi TaxID=360622 RepID=A0AAD8I106_9APIA|nr:putative U3 small nucleolar RNA-associated protein 13 [Heracleum sosnowskyi]
MGTHTFPLPSQTFDQDSTDQTNNFSSDSSMSSSISSQPSLPSVPSLNKLSQEIFTIHHHCISTLKGHSSNVFSLALSGKHLYSGSSNSELRVWSQTPSDHHNSTDNIVSSCKSAVKCIVILGDKLFSAHQDHKIRVWKIEHNTPSQNYKCVSTLPTLSDRVTRLIFSGKNSVETGKHKKSTWVHHDTVSALALSIDGSFLYSASWDRTFKIWRTSDYKCLESVFNAHDDAINAIVSSSDGYIYTGSGDRKIKVWGKNGDNKHSIVDTLMEHKSAINALALGSDGDILYSGACDRSIIVWEKTDGGGHMAVTGALRGHTKPILCLAVVSELLCSGSADKTVRIWTRKTDRSYSCLAVLEGHTGPVKCLTAAIDYSSAADSNISPAAGAPYLIYSGSLDCDVKVWQIWVPFV